MDNLNITGKFLFSYYANFISIPTRLTYYTVECAKHSKHF